jgi:hypothetical protein
VRRWDSDTIGVGISDAVGVVPEIHRLRDACRRPGWVAEAADTYLGVSLHDACERPDSPWTWIEGVQETDGTYVVDLRYAQLSDAQLWPDLMVLLSEIAEDSFFVQRLDEQTVVCVTGSVSGRGEFAPHGHTLCLRLS